MFCKKSCPKNVRKTHKKTAEMELLLVLALVNSCWRSPVSYAKILRTASCTEVTVLRCFSKQLLLKNFAIFIRKLESIFNKVLGQFFYKEHLRWLLLDAAETLAYSKWSWFIICWHSLKFKLASQLIIPLDTSVWVTQRDSGSYLSEYFVKVQKPRICLNLGASKM